MKVQELIIAVPCGGDEKPQWEKAMLTTTSLNWCGKTKIISLPDGNKWRNNAGFLCLERWQQNSPTFQEIRRKNPAWGFGWGCHEDDEGCIVTK